MKPYNPRRELHVILIALYLLITLVNVAAGTYFMLKNDVYLRRLQQIDSCRQYRMHL